MADGVSEKSVLNGAAQAQNSMLAVVIIQLIAQIVLKKGLDDLWSMFFTL
jgi:hypothetical protein